LGSPSAPSNQYSKAKQTNNDTSGAQQVAERGLKMPYSESGIYSANPATGAAPASGTPAPSLAGDRPVPKKPSRYGAYRTRTVSPPADGWACMFLRAFRA
jgi:hypothetical protein